MMGFRFQDPLWLLLLIPLAVAGLWMLRRRRHAAVLYSSVDLLKNLPVTLAQRVKRLLPWVFLAGLALWSSPWPGRSTAKRNSASGPRESPSRWSSIAPARCGPWISSLITNGRPGWRW